MFTEQATLILKMVGKANGAGSNHYTLAEYKTMAEVERLVAETKPEDLLVPDLEAGTVKV